LRHGLYVPTEGAFADVSLLAHLAQSAEVAGWDGFFVWDELLPILDPGAPVVDSYVALTAIAATTEHLRIGALVTPVARHRPETFAKQAATLDRLSNGRLTVGVGLGYPPQQFSAFGGPAGVRERAAMVDEFLELLTRIWTGEPVEFDGEHYTATGVALRPTPAQQPRIPIWVAGDIDHRAAWRRAARWDGFVPASTSWPDGVVTPDEFDTMLAAIGPTAGYDVAVIGSATDPTRTDDAALEAYAQVGVTWALAQSLDVDELRRRIRNGPPGGP
jgi:alkanesulfonate monooxygenase SsuD/methylene tetrahydromethanopterin reductase-like flavin-dependent oxidoreductase (luciferase family)